MQNSENGLINTDIKRAVIKLSGRVQGVGFRPFAYRLAEKYGIKGYVLNNAEGVEIDAEGKKDDLSNFIKSLDSDSEKPPLAIINDKTVDFTEPFFYKSFEVKESDKTGNRDDNRKNNKLNLTIPPDIAICGKCLDELFNPSDRRYLYPFINCTDCGPRFTISKGLPYDRASTSMDKFKMCIECQAEYKNPLSRRFHAEPNGCFVCGPEVEFVLSSDIPDIPVYIEKINTNKEAEDINKALELKRSRSLNAVKSLVNLIKDGGIVCVKGIGGFHLMADAANDDALKLLRERKSRPKKPFAVMFKDTEQVLKYAYADDISAGLLVSKERPICLLKDKGNLSYYVNCGLKDIGVFLPYAPLHYIVFSLFDGPLAATSANIGGEPIVKDNEEAFLKLKGIADGFLIHNRDILRRCDDSVIKADIGDTGKQEGCEPFFIRRSRGYVPEPFKLPFNLKRNVLAAGAFLKNTFALAYAGKDAGAVVLSQHNGDLDNIAGFVNFKENIEDFKKFYNFKPDIIVYDSHPAYESTKWAKQSAKERNIRDISLQHHSAHVISCMAENGLGLNEEVFGIAFDGTGYGDDGTIWGGEFFKGNYKNLKRTGSFKKFRLIGGDKAVKSPKRVLLSIIFGILFESGSGISILHNRSYNGIKYADAFGIISDLTGFSEKEISIFLKMWKNGLNSPFTSSCGRIFDAVSCLCGFNGDITYEGEAAVYLENLCGKYKNNGGSGEPDNLISGKDCFKYGYKIDYSKADDFFTVDYNPMFNDIIQTTFDNRGTKGIKSLKTENKAGMDIIYKNTAERFVNTLVIIIRDTALNAGCKNVCMSGGVFQNALLRNKAAAILKENGFNAYFNEKIPANDGGISFGQAVYGGIID
jgi:hydrogenase maturation protein HypF